MQICEKRLASFLHYSLKIGAPGPAAPSPPTLCLLSKYIIEMRKKNDFEAVLKPGPARSNKYLTRLLFVHDRLLIGLINLTKKICREYESSRLPLMRKKIIINEYIYIYSYTYNFNFTSFFLSPKLKINKFWMTEAAKQRRTTTKYNNN